MKRFFPALLFFSLALFSCSDSGPGKDEIKIGALLPLTGSGSSTGESMRKALEIGVEQMNADLEAGGSNYAVRVLFEDSKTDTTVAKSKLQSLYNNGIRMVIGPYSSSECLALKSFADQKGILLLSPSSVSANLAIEGDNLFRLSPDDHRQGEALVALWNQLGVDIIIPFVRNDAWGNGLLSIVKDQFEAQGGQVGTPILYPTSTGDFSELVGDLDFLTSYVVSSNPGAKVAVFLASFGEGTPILAAASGFSHFDGIQWFGSSAFALNSSLPVSSQASQFAITHDFYCPVFGLSPDYQTGWQPVQAALIAALGRTPEVYALTAYDGLQLALETYVETGFHAPFSQLKESLGAKASVLVGVTGPLAFNAAGDRSFAIYDLWKITSSGSSFSWTLGGQYHNQTGILVLQ